MLYRSPAPASLLVFRARRARRADSARAGAWSTWAAMNGMRHGQSVVGTRGRRYEADHLLEAESRRCMVRRVQRARARGARSWLGGCPAARSGWWDHSGISAAPPTATIASTSIMSKPPTLGTLHGRRSPAWAGLLVSSPEYNLRIVLEQPRWSGRLGHTRRSLAPDYRRQRRRACTRLAPTVRSHGLFSCCRISPTAEDPVKENRCADPPR